MGDELDDVLDDEGTGSIPLIPEEDEEDADDTESDIDGDDDLAEMDDDEEDEM